MKGLFKKTWGYFLTRLMRLSGEWRVFMVLILLFIVLREYTGSIRAMCRMTGENISPYFFPFLLGDYIVATGLSKILILLIFIIIVCNVSCKQEEIYYYAIRTGYRAMVYGDILFIGILALGYCMYVYLCSILCFLPYVTIQGDWGRIIGTLAYTNAAGQYGYMFVIPTGIMEMYSAPNGVLLSFVLLFAGCFMLGLTVYMLNLFFQSKYYGIGISCFLILLSPIVSYSRIPGLYWFSPMSWISAENLYPVQNTQYPSVSYAAGMLIAIICCITSVLSIHCRKLEIGGVQNGWTAD